MIKSSITDSPRNISKGEKDNFGIEPFENGLTDFINKSNTPITISLQGEWGSGKTSLMNSLKMNLSDSENSKYHSVWLNTWEFALMKDAQSTLMEIIVGLIHETTKIAKLDEDLSKQILGKVVKVGGYLGKFASKTVANKTGIPVDDLVDNIFNNNSKSSISEIRDDLEKIISDCIKKDNKQGFIFFIDDLDRIDPPVAVQLLELLKNIFTLKNCVFVLAIDYDVVIKGLEPKFGKLSDQNEREFRSFFDKIIQVPFSMPVSSYETDKFLKESLISTDYINEEIAKNDELIAKFSEISNLSVGKNPRALKRLMNSLSLISCINSTKNKNEENDQLNSELELLVNFALVSIQIAYPPVYRLLALHSGFEKWNENTAIQMNLKQLDQQSIDKLNQSPEFDEEWEKILFRLCENDHYLKKRALNISRLLNSLKNLIIDKEEEIEDVIGAVISLSSVTNLEAFDKPLENYHKGNFLKHLRSLLIPELKKALPEIANTINTTGKRVQTNAHIRFTEDWQMNVELSSTPIKEGVRLKIRSVRYMCALKFNGLDDCIERSNLTAEFEKLKMEYDNFEKKFSNIIPTQLFNHIAKSDNSYVVDLDTYYLLPTTEDFYKKENINDLCKVIVERHYIMVQLEALAIKLSEKINPA